MIKVRFHVAKITHARTAVSYPVISALENELSLRALNVAVLLSQIMWSFANMAVSLARTITRVRANVLKGMDTLKWLIAAAVKIL